MRKIQGWRGEESSCTLAINTTSHTEASSQVVVRGDIYSWALPFLSDSSCCFLLPLGEAADTDCGQGHRMLCSFLSHCVAWGKSLPSLGFNLFIWKMGEKIKNKRGQAICSKFSNPVPLLTGKWQKEWKGLPTSSSPRLMGGQGNKPLCVEFQDPRKRWGMKDHGPAELVASVPGFLF